MKTRLRVMNAGAAQHRFILILALLSLGIITGGTIYFRQYEKHYRIEVERQLSAIAEMKVDELMDWRKERLADASIFHKNAAFSVLVRRFFENPGDADAKRLLQDWIGRCQTSYQYVRVFLTDTQGVIRLSAPEASPMDVPHLARDAAVDLASGQIDFLDLHRDKPDDPVHMAVMVPIFDDQDGHRPLGLVALRIDPATYLYPFIERWPIPSQTAESLLIRREGDEAVFLNELRFQTNTALNLRSSLTNTSMPAVKAALGQEGIVEGIDYRGVSVIADVRRVPDSPWFLVTRMDISEVYAPLRRGRWIVIMVVVILLFSAGAGVSLAWQQSTKAQYKALFESEKSRHETEERYRTTLLSVGDGVIATDAEGRVSLLNPVAEELTGWKQEEAEGRLLEEVFRIINEETRQPVKNPVQRVIREGLIVGLANHTVLVARNGVERAIADSGAPIRDENGVISGVVLVFRDQSAMRATERALRRGEAILDETGSIARIGGWEHDMVTGRATWTKALHEIFESESGEPPGPNEHLNYYPPDDRARLAGAYQRAMKTGEPFDLDLQVFTAKKRLIWARVIGHPIMEDGRCMRMVGTFQDITERKRVDAGISRLLEQSDKDRTALLGILEDEKQAEEEIRKQLDELRRWQAVTIDREGRVAELKLEVNELAARLGEKPRYGAGEK